MNEKGLSANSKLSSRLEETWMKFLEVRATRKSGPLWRRHTQQGARLSNLNENENVKVIVKVNDKSDNNNDDDDNDDNDNEEIMMTTTMMVTMRR